MIQHYRYIYMLLIVLCLVGCDKEIKYKGEQTTPLLVMNGIVEADSTLSIKLSKSIFFLSNNQSTNVSEGKVYIQINDKEKVEMYENDYYNGKFESNIRLQTGERCKFMAEGDNLTPIWSEVSLIQKSNFEILSYTTDGLTGKIKLRIHDPEEEDMCYRLFVNSYFYTDREHGRNYESSSEFTSKDKLLNRSEDMYDSYITDYFDDEYFHGRSYDLELTIEYPYASYYYGEIDKSWESDPENRKTLFSLEVNLQSLSRELYLYYCTFDAAMENAFNMFSEPIQIYTNVNEGIGCIGVVNNNNKILYRDNVIWEEYNNRSYLAPKNHHRSY